MTEMNFLGNKILDQKTRRKSVRGLSPGALSILVTLIANADSENIVHKSKMEKLHNKCNRTWNKYWNELLTAELLIKVPFKAKLWMIDPCIVRDRTANVRAIKGQWKAFRTWPYEEFDKKGRIIYESAD